MNHTSKEKWMHRRTAARRATAASALAAFSLALSADPGAAGEYVVSNCQADPDSFSTRAFDSVLTRGMTIRRACDPYGTGRRGLITSNIIRHGTVAPGAVAVARMASPPGTHFRIFRWAGSAHREDCRYALHVVAYGPAIKPIPIKNVRANQGCPKPARAQAATFGSRTFNVAGATEILQRVVCVGHEKRRACSARSLNYVKTTDAEARIIDEQAPTAEIITDTPLSQGQWVRGTQPLNYVARDNVGVRRTDGMLAGTSKGSDVRSCDFATPEETYAVPFPCPSGTGQIAVNTERVRDGTHPLSLQPQDPAGNLGSSPPTTARIDNGPPPRVDVSLEGGDGWRNHNDFAAVWINPLEIDRAPIAGLSYKLCRAGTDRCEQGQEAGSEISRLTIAPPGPGEWTLALWRRDAAGNETAEAASAPVTLRYDPEPPQLGFEPPTGADPTRVAVAVIDALSGLATGAIEISKSGSGVWQTLATEATGSQLLARIDDSVLPAGSYELRARASDRASNEASTSKRLDGAPMAVTLPLRSVSTIRGGFERTRTVRRTIRRAGKRRIVRRRVTTRTRAVRVRSGQSAMVSGRLVDQTGSGIAGAEIDVFSRSNITPEQRVAVVQTDDVGRYRFTAAGRTSRTLRFAFAGSPLVLPAERTLTMRVPGRTSLRVNRRRVLNGQAVRFSGRLRTRPAPPAGKLVELQARLSDRWQTFRTARTDAKGRWTIRYRFKRTRGLQQFRFRARLPREASYPFTPGGSRPISVRVRGPR